MCFHFLQFAIKRIKDTSIFGTNIRGTKRKKTCNSKIKPGAIVVFELCACTVRVRPNIEFKIHSIICWNRYNGYVQWKVRKVTHRSEREELSKSLFSFHLYSLIDKTIWEKFLCILWMNCVYICRMQKLLGQATKQPTISCIRQMEDSENGF